MLVQAHLSTRNRSLRHSRRKGAYLVLFAFSMLSMLGILALIHDVALIHYYTNHCQNIADLSAIAGSRELASGASTSTAIAKAQQYLITINSTDSTLSDVQSPPTNGSYQGKTGFIEVVARKQVTTWFMRSSLLGPASVNVWAKSIAGVEFANGTDAIHSLNQNARPGLQVSNTSSLSVDGRIVVNSNGGGLDENNTPINNGSSGYSISTGTSSLSPRGINAKRVDSFGGVDYPFQIRAYSTGDPAPLKTRVAPQADPLSNLETPTVNNGVDARTRGSINISSTTVSGLSNDTSGQNRLALANESVANGLYIAQQGDVILHPGIYTRIWVSGGRVFFVPGIYVLRPSASNFESLRLTGGTVIANGVMFYNTGATYNPTNGLPDSNDLETTPPATPSTTFAQVWLNQSVRTTPIDTSLYNYGSYYSGAKSVSSVFNGISFYQRRHNVANFQFTGDDLTGEFQGLLYGKWMKMTISGNRFFKSRFVLSDLFISGGSRVTVTPLPSSNNLQNTIVYLVE